MSPRLRTALLALALTASSAGAEDLSSRLEKLEREAAQRPPAEPAPAEKAAPKAAAPASPVPASPAPATPAASPAAATPPVAPPAARAPEAKPAAAARPRPRTEGHVEKQESSSRYGVLVVLALIAIAVVIWFALGSPMPK